MMIEGLDISLESLESLEEMRTQVEFDVLNIKNQLAVAKSRAFEEGVYAPSDWFNRATHALRIKGFQHQCLLREIAKRKKEQAAEVSDDAERAFNKAFVATAKQWLSPHLFNTIAEAAKK